MQRRLLPRATIDTAGAGGTGASGGAGGTAGTGSSNGDCNPVGRYEVGKEGGYRPCCAGLNEISTLSLLTSDSNLVCDQLPLNTFACIEGTCGDGTCEENEKACGCAGDCPDVPGPARDLICSPFFDQTPPPVLPRQISITNAGAQTLYLEPSRGAACSGILSLVSVERAGQSVNIYGSGCGRTCQGIADRGATAIPAGSDPAAWESADSLDTSCPDLCAAPPLTPIAPGETLTQSVSREIGVQYLPRECAQGIVTETIACYSWVIPQPGVYDIRVRAFAQPGCDSGTCPATELTKQGDWFFEDHTFVLGAPVP
jgi:hypothetical protein